VRLFFAIMLPDEVREQIGQVQYGLRSRIGREGVRWEDPIKLHVTLRFLGEFPEERLGDAVSIGADAAAACAPFEVELEKIGAYPSNTRPRVLWIGSEIEVPVISRLQEYLRRAHELSAGSPRSDHLGTPPHVTLARAKSPQGASAIRAALAEKIGSKLDKKAVISVYNIVLVESELRPEGSRYRILETFPLAAN
jgi:2'-5' RNA ligase